MKLSSVTLSMGFSRCIWSTSESGQNAPQEHFLSPPKVGFLTSHRPKTSHGGLPLAHHPTTDCSLSSLNDVTTEGQQCVIIDSPPKSWDLNHTTPDLSPSGTFGFTTSAHHTAV